MSANEVVLHELSEAIASAAAEGNEKAVELLTESFDRLRTVIGREDRGWIPLRGGDSATDPFMLRLDDLKAWGDKIEESTPGAPWMGAGFRRRANFIWENGIRYGNVPEPKQGRTNIQEIIDRPANQLHFFGKTARRKREHNLFARGIAIWVGYDDTKDIEAIPLRQITGQLMDPTGLGIVWAYLREWAEVDLATGDSVKKKEWIFTDRFFNKKPDSIRTKGRGGKTVPVSKNSRIFDQHANQIEGYAYGTPDGLAAWIWNAVARDSYMDGRSVTQALTRFALKATAKTKAGAESAALQYANADTAGGMAIVGGANDISVMASAGKGYEFDTLRPLLAVIATSLDIPNVALTGDSGSDSFASISTLDLPTRLAMQARRDEHIELDTRVLTWLGVQSPDIAFIPYNAGEEMYRKEQSLALELQNDIIDRQEYRDQVDDMWGRPNGKVPTEEERESYLKAKATAAAAPAPAAGSDKSGTSTASPNQGRSNGTGGQSGAANDLRKDKISK